MLWNQLGWLQSMNQLLGKDKCVHYCWVNINWRNIRKKRKISGQSRVEKVMEHTKFNSIPALSNIKEGIYTDKEKSLSTCSTKDSPSHSPISTSNPHLKKDSLLQGEAICQVDRKALERNLFLRRKALLRPLFKCTSIDFPSMEDPRNFPQVPGVITLIRNAGGKLKV